MTTDESDNSKLTEAGGHWAPLLAAAGFLFGDDRRFDDVDDPRLDRMWIWTGAVALAWGCILAAIWALAANAFPYWKSSDIPLMPAAAVVGAMALGPYRRALAAPAKLLSPGESASATTISAAVVVILALSLLGIPPFYREGVHLPSWLAWIRPQTEYRVLILMPLWGAWAMMTPLHFCKVDSAGALVRAFANRQPVIGTAMWMALALAMSLWQLSCLRYGWVALPAGLALAAGSLGAVAICRFSGGITHSALLAANLMTQLAFLLGYLAGATHLLP